MPICPGVPMHMHAARSHAHQCWVRLFTILTKPMYSRNSEQKSGYMFISPGAPHTLPIGFLAPCSRLPGYAGCTSSLTCSVWWCAGDGPAPQTGWGPLHVQSRTHALPRQMFGCPRSSVHGGVHWHTAPPSLADVHVWVLHIRDGVHNSFTFFDWDWVLWAYQHWRRVRWGRNTTLTPRGVRIRLIASDSSLMYGSETFVFALSTSTSCLLPLVVVLFWGKPER